jgi:hypothetical protein
MNQQETVVLEEDNMSPIIFIKLRHGEDLVAYLLEENETSFHIKRPMLINVMSDMQTGKQMISVKEWMPPIITDMDDAFISKKDIYLSAPVRDSFKEEITGVINYFYSVEPIRRVRKSSNSAPSSSSSIKEDPESSILLLAVETSSKIH